MGAEVCRVLARVADDLVEQTERAGVQVAAVDAEPLCGFPVPVVEVTVQVVGDEPGVRSLAQSLGLAVCDDEVRPGPALPHRATAARRWVTWSGWCPDASVQCPVLWRLQALFPVDGQAAA